MRVSLESITGAAPVVVNDSTTTVASAESTDVLAITNYVENCTILGDAAPSAIVPPVSTYRGNIQSKIA